MPGGTEGVKGNRTRRHDLDSYAEKDVPDQPSCTIAVSMLPLRKAGADGVGFRRLIREPENPSPPAHLG